MMPKIYFNILPKAQKRVWGALSEGANNLKQSGFYLAGGTALALQLGHRQSVDFDFFSEKANQSNKIVSWLEKARGLIVRDMNAHTVHVEIDEVKVSFIGGYRYPRVKELIWVDEIGLADTLDIGLLIRSTLVL